MPKLKLNQCVECGRTYNPNDVGTSLEKCETHHQKDLSEARRKDALRKSMSRKNNPSGDLERLAEIEE